MKICFNISTIRQLKKHRFWNSICFYDYF